MIRRFSLYVCWCIFIGFFLVIPIEAQTVKYISRSSVDSILNPKIQVGGERILRFEQKEQSIGVMSENELPKSLNFSFRNVGTKAVKIQELKTFCGCTSAVYDRQIIEPDSTGKIVVTYNPKNRVGTVDERIYIYTTDSNQTPIASLSILGEVKEESQWRHLPKKMGNLRLKRNFVDFNTTLSGHGNCHSVFCNSIHSGTHHRNVKLDLFGQMSSKIYLIRNHFRICRYQQHVIKCNSFANNCSHDFSSLSLIRSFVIIFFCYKYIL